MTNNQKIECYKWARKSIAGNNTLTICIELFAAFIHLGYGTADNITAKQFVEQFPELYRRKPEYANRGGYWWTIDDRGQQLRLAAIDHILKELHG